jgi:predicted Zn-dependent peptidase
VERSRTGFAAGLKEQMAATWGQGFDALRWAMLGDVAFRRAMNPGPPERIAEVSRDDLVSWHKATFRRCCALVIVAGSLDGARAGSAVDSLFAGLPEGDAVVKRAPEADFTPRRILLHRPDATASLLAFVGQRPPKRREGRAEDVALMDALNAAGGPLLETVRTRLRAAYRFSATYDEFGAANGFMLFWGEVDTGKLADAEIAIREAYVAFREKGPRDSFDARKARLTAEVTDAKRYPADASQITLRGALLGPGLPPLPAQQLAEMTRESLMARLQKFPPAEAFTVIAVSPDAEALPGACVITAPEQAVRCR